MTKPTLILCLFLAACGGNSKPPVTPKPEPVKMQKLRVIIWGDCPSATHMQLWVTTAEDTRRPVEPFRYRFTIIDNGYNCVKAKVKCAAGWSVEKEFCWQCDELGTCVERED